MVQKIILNLLLLFVSKSTFSQPITQTIRGTIIDKESKALLPSASIVLLYSNPLKVVTSDTFGNFVISNVAIGRQNIEISLQGYKTSVVSDIQLGAAKEIILQVELVEKTNRISNSNNKNR